MSLLSGNINLNNVNIKPDKVNELFKKKNLPIALKAGLISKINVKVIYKYLFNNIVIFDKLILRFFKSNC
jgi:hypothetical protein